MYKENMFVVSVLNFVAIMGRGSRKIKFSRHLAGEVKGWSAYIEPHIPKLTTVKTSGMNLMIAVSNERKLKMYYIRGRFVSITRSVACIRSQK